MAKTKTISITSTNCAFSIKPTTASANYVYDSSLSDKQNISFNASVEKTKYTGYRNLVYRKDNDLVVVTKFLKSNSIKKTVISTVKNYFTDTHASNVNNNGTVLYSSTITPDQYNSLYNEVFKGKTYENGTGYNAVIGNNKSNTYNLSNSGGDKIFDEKGNETYNVSHSEGTSKIIDYKGKDKYNFTSNSYSSVTEYTGSDKYKFDGGRGTVFDYTGNDKYTVTNNTGGNGSGSVEITDAKGKDKYNFYNSSKVVRVREQLGNDKYTMNNVSDPYIEDEKGNDKYTVSNSTRVYGSYDNINDKAGNDKYTFTNVQGGAIDSSTGNFLVKDDSGNDKYTIKGQNGSSTNKNLKIIDGYNVYDKILSGNDEYNLTNASYVEIEDNGGKNKFNLKGSSLVRITTNDASAIGGLDKSFSDKYNVSGIAPVYKKKKLKKEAEYVKGVIIRDNSLTSNDTYNYSYYEHYYTDDEIFGNFIDVIDRGGSDTYNIKNTKSIEIRDYQSKDGSYKNTFNIKNTEKFIIDVSGKNAGDVGNYVATNDTYNIVSSAGTIFDYSDTSNDTYKINKLSDKVGGDGYVSIQDWGGTGDSLVISDAKAKNLVFMSDGGATTNLYIYDKKDHGFAILSNYFGDWLHDEVDKDDNGKYNLIDTSECKIETIKAGKTNVNSYIMSANELNSMKSQITSWLNTHGTNGSLAQTLQNASTNQYINDLCQLFTKS